MQTDPTEPQGKITVSLYNDTIILETPPDLDHLLDKAACNSPNQVETIPYYSIIWPSSIALARYLNRECAHLITGQRVMELGCGLGAPSIVCAKMGADVTASDFHPDAAEWLLHNARINEAEVHYQQLNWQDYIRKEHSSTDSVLHFPLIVGSDLVYEKDHIAALVCAINALCASGGEVLIADPGRDNLTLFIDAMHKSHWMDTLFVEDDIYIMRFTRQLLSKDKP